jgi:hypothetical protein
MIARDRGDGEAVDASAAPHCRLFPETIAEGLEVAPSNSGTRGVGG